MNQTLKELAKKYKVRLTHPFKKAVNRKRVKKSEQLVKTQVRNEIKRLKSVSLKRSKKTSYSKRVVGNFRNSFNVYKKFGGMNAKSTKDAKVKHLCELLKTRTTKDILKFDDIVFVDYLSGLGLSNEMIIGKLDDLAKQVDSINDEECLEKVLRLITQEYRLFWR